MTSASAPGKVILFGEHAVVYGRPALAVPVRAVEATVHVEELKGDRVQIRSREIGFEGWLDELPENDPLQLAVRLTLSELRQETVGGLQVSIESEIPPSSGMGSSAAVSVAIIRALSSHFEIELERDRISELAFEIEQIHHGDPSGIDNTVVAFGIPLLFIKGQLPRSVGVTKSFELVIGDTGEPSPTKQLVTMLRGRWTGDQEFMDALFDSIGELSNQAAAAIGRGEITNMGPLMDHGQTLLEALGVSSESLGTLIGAARQAGAMGAKLSGAGGGGIMIALVDSSTADAVEQALNDAGAVRTLRTTVG